MRNKIYYFSVIIFLALFSRMFSQSAQDLQKMKSEYERLQKGQFNIQQSPSSQLNVGIDTGIPSQAILSTYPFEAMDSVEIGLKHFGYDFFTLRDTVKFWENLPATANYLLGPGDELIVTLWGETQVRETYTISREGKIYNDKVGLMNMGGKTIGQSKKYLMDQFSRVYATLKGERPSTFMDVSLGKLRSINVNFVGEVKFPGVYPIHSFSTVITGLIQAGGIDTTGSLRNIRILRDGKKFTDIDLYSYLLKGNVPNQIQLRDQDVVVVPVRLSRVEIDSAVVRPGIYESISGETIRQMIDNAGGLTPFASSIIGLERITPIQNRKKDEIDYKNYYIDFENADLTLIQNGDKIIVQSILKAVAQVEIIGQVKKPGKYYYYPGMRIKDLLRLSSGFEDTTFWKSVYHDRAELVRRNPETRYEKVFELNLNNILYGNAEENLLLNNLDRFVVHANLNFFEKKNVQILGEVNIPGAYPLISDNETLRSLLDRAGNLTSKALKNGISIFRDKEFFEISDNKIDISEEIYPKSSDEYQIQEKVRVAWQNESIVLMPGDSVIVKETTKTVNLSGEVYNPGLIEYRDGKSLRYYLNAAGGITNVGNKKGIIVVYANGIVSPKKWYSSPRIEDGSTIIVNAKENTSPFNLTQFATNWTSIISSMITAVILSQQLSSQQQ